MFENNFQEGNCKRGHNCNTKHINHTFSTNCKGKWFFIIKSARFSTKFFCSTSSFLNESFKTKNSNIEKLKIRNLFFANYLSTFSLNKQVNKNKIVKNTKVFVCFQNNLYQALHHKPKAKKIKQKKEQKTWD